MPALIDTEQRRRRIVDAALRLIVTGGLAAATFRKVAAEADLNIGSVRHAFTDHESLIVAVATEVGDRMGQRLARHTAPAPGDRVAAKQHLLAVVEELVPLDDQRHREAIVLLEVITASRRAPAFEPTVAQMASDLHQVLVDGLTAAGVVAPAREAIRLAALISGLSTDAVTPHGPIDRATIHSLLAQHIAELRTTE